MGVLKCVWLLVVGLRREGAKSYVFRDLLIETSGEAALSPTAKDFEFSLEGYWLTDRSLNLDFDCPISSSFCC